MSRKVQFQVLKISIRFVITLLGITVVTWPLAFWMLATLRNALELLFPEQLLSEIYQI